jgi:TRAP-type uncharacterized transport system substrate-binding protein
MLTIVQVSIYCAANPPIPVHPGLAKFLKEKKASNDKWTIAGK